MIRSQKNCLFDNHRFTHERWEGDLQGLFDAQSPHFGWRFLLLIEED